MMNPELSSRKYHNGLIYPTSTLAIGPQPSPLNQGGIQTLNLIIKIVHLCIVTGSCLSNLLPTRWLVGRVTLTRHSSTHVYDRSSASSRLNPTIRSLHDTGCEKGLAQALLISPCRTSSDIQPLRQHKSMLGINT